MRHLKNFAQLNEELTSKHIVTVPHPNDTEATTVLKSLNIPHNEAGIHPDKDKFYFFTNDALEKFITTLEAAGIDKSKFFIKMINH